MVMDQALWAGLPEHLVDKVLALLPVASFHRFRCVCKRWNDLILSSSFRQACNQAPTEETWLILQNCSLTYAYSYDSNKWYTFPATSFMPSSKYVTFLASDGGLIFYSLSSTETLHVYNPFTRFGKILPQPHLAQGPPLASQMVMDPSGQTYRIFTLSHEHWHMDSDRGVMRMRLVVELYHSISNSWEVISEVLPSKIEFYSSLVVCNDIIYCTVHFEAPEYSVWALNLQRSAWCEIQVPMVPKYSRFKLVGCHGRLLLVARIEASDSCETDMKSSRKRWRNSWSPRESPLSTKDSTVCIQIWELDQSDYQWVEMFEVTNQAWLPIDPRLGNDISFTFQAQGDLLFLPFPQGSIKVGIKILVCNLTTQGLLCGPPLFPPSYANCREFLFKPRLGTSV